MHPFRSLALLTAGLCIVAAPALAAPPAVPPAISTSSQGIADFGANMAAHLQDGPVAATGSNAADGALSTDEAKIAMGVQVYDNLHIYEVFMVGFTRGFQQDPHLAAWPQADRDLLLSLLREEMGKRKAEILRAMAASVVDSYSTDQLNQLVALSKIKFLQDLFLYSADKTAPVPDQNSMTPSDQALFTSMMNQEWVTRFFKADVNAINPVAERALRAAFARFDAAKQQQAK